MILSSEQNWQPLKATRVVVGEELQRRDRSWQLSQFRKINVRTWAEPFVKSALRQYCGHQERMEKQPHTRQSLCNISVATILLNKKLRYILFIYIFGGLYYLKFIFKLFPLLFTQLAIVQFDRAPTTLGYIFSFYYLNILLILLWLSFCYLSTFLSFRFRFELFWVVWCLP